MLTKLTHKNGLTFNLVNRDLQSSVDVPLDQGGSNSAPTPKEMVLNAMCACSAMDVVTIAKKMHIEVGEFWMEGSSEKSLTLPSYFSSVHLKYFFKGENLNNEKLIQAIALSMTKYCGVSYMISKVCDITYDVTVNDSLIHQDKANFALEPVGP